MQIIPSILLLSCVCYVSGFGHFRYEIPNGERVSDPCKPKTFWKGVGHRTADGGGRRNQFGFDFHANNKMWTRTLCMMDSDGDGQSNGQELGDPDCVWVKDGGPPSSTDNITHPGICTPFSSLQCQGKNELVDCSKEELVCPSLRRPDTQNVTLRFPRTQVPAKETTYISMIFDVPSDQDYHLVAYKPEIDNKNSVHHILLFRCMGHEPIPTEPFESGMVLGHGCEDMLIGGWAHGSTGDCFGDMYGIKFGKAKYSRMALHIHWNNPKLENSWFDSSGLTLFFTHNLRPNNAAILNVGQKYLEIPPGQPSTTFTSTCSGECTKAAMSAPIHVVSAFSHMHYLGYAQVVEHWRNGSRLRYMINQTAFRRDNPKFTYFDPPLEILPKDELVTICRYNSTNSKKWTYYGESTSDEMCYAFMMFYPSEAMPEPYCFSWKSVPLCVDRKLINSIRGCDKSLFENTIDPKLIGIYTSVNSECNLNGHCNNNCRYAVLEAKKHPCLRGGEITENIKHQLQTIKEGSMFLKRLEMCAVKEDGVVANATNQS